MLIHYLGIKQPSGVDGKVLDLIFKEDELDELKEKVFSREDSSGEKELEQQEFKNNNDDNVCRASTETFNKGTFNKGTFNKGTFNKGAFNKEKLTKEALNKEEEDAIFQRLKNLGYLE